MLKSNLKGTDGIIVEKEVIYMEKRSGLKMLLLVPLVLVALLTCVHPAMAWQDSSNNVTIYDQEQWNGDFHYGDDIYIRNDNAVPIFVYINLTNYHNIQFSVGGSVGPNEERKIGWVVCADNNDPDGWYYTVGSWSWEEEYRAF